MKQGQKNIWQQMHVYCNYNLHYSKYTVLMKMKIQIKEHYFLLLIIKGIIHALKIS